MSIGTLSPPVPAAALRLENAWRLLGVLRSKDNAFTAPALATLTGLTRPTVDAALAPLDRKGWICEAGAGPSSGGRPAMRYRAAPEGAWLAAVTFYVPEVVGVVLDLRGREVARVAHAIPKSSSTPNALAALESLIEELIDAARRAFGPQAPERFLAASVAVAGTLSKDRETSHELVRLRGWKDVRLAARLRQVLSRRECAPVVIVERYLTALGLAMSRPSADRAGEGEVRLCMEVSAGVGVAIPELDRAAGVNAGEFGFTLLDPAGPADASGRRGTVEAFLSDDRVRARAAERRLAWAEGHKDTSAFYAALGRAYESGDAFAAELAERYAQALANLCGLFAPECLEVRGAIAAAGGVFQARVAERLAHCALRPCACEWRAMDLCEPALALGRENLNRRLKDVLFERS